MGTEAVSVTLPPDRARVEARINGLEEASAAYALQAGVADPTAAP
jgi:hypothetical protein